MRKINWATLCGNRLKAGRYIDNFFRKKEIRDKRGNFQQEERIDSKDSMRQSGPESFLHPFCVCCLLGLRTFWFFGRFASHM